MSDVRLTAVAAVVGVVLLYYIGYRRIGALLYSSAPLIAGQILTFAAAYLAFGKLNSASSGFVAMVMGLGTDFTIVMYSRYVEERRNGLSLAEASRRMMGEGGLGMFTGAITSAGTFYAMCVTEFRGLWEMGFLIGTGILLSMVSIVFLLPAMIQWNEGRRRKRDVIHKLHVQSFGFERLIPLAARHAGFTLALVLGITIILGIAAWNIGFSDNIADLRSPANAGLIAQAKLRDKFAADLNTMVAIVRAPDADAAVEKARGVVERSRPFLDKGILRDTDSLVDYLPSPADQRRLFAAFRSEEEQGALSFARVERAFRSALEAEGFREGAFDSYLADLQSVMTRSEPITLTDLRQHDLGALLKRYVSDTADASGRPIHQIAVYLFPEEGYRREAPPGLAEALQEDDPDITVTGVNIVSKRLREIFAHDATMAIGIGLVLVSILLWLDFRSLRLMIVANAQVLTGVIWMLGAVSLAGLQISFVNCFVATMILGVGVDYGIHLIHRMCLNGGVVDDGVLETGKGVAMAALTNVVGFGSLALSNYPGLRSVGIIAMVGSAACLMTSLTLLPALMSLKGFASAAEMHEARPVDA
jgi:predicted RND superfamily exporter protein